MKLDELQQLEIIKLYKNNPKQNCVKLAKQFNVSDVTIGNILRAKNIIIRNDPATFSRVYTLNQSSFNKIDAQNKAYWLGFLYADGNNCNGRLAVSLSEIDKEHIEKLKQFLNTNRPLWYRKSNIIKIKYRNKTYVSQPIWGLTVNSQILCQDLEKLGCVPNKSLILKFPTEQQVPDHLIRHFIRGYFDGDGCIYFNLKNSKSKIGRRFIGSVYFVSPRVFCEKLKEILKNELNIHSTISNQYTNKITHSLSIGGRVQIIDFLNWIYKDSTIHLQRKWDKYQELLKIKLGKWQRRVPKK